MLENLLRFASARLREKSTWVGIASLVTILAGPAFGLVVDKVGQFVILILGSGLITLPTTDVAPSLKG